MKPPLRQIANQVSKIEVSWPATLPFPRIAPLMSKVASIIPDVSLPGTPGSSSLIRDIRTQFPRTTGLPAGMITDISQIQPGARALLTETPRGPEPIFESVEEGPTYQGGNLTQAIIPLSFE